MLFSELYKIMVNNVTFVGFRERDRLNCPTGLALLSAKFSSWIKPLITPLLPARAYLFFSQNFWFQIASFYI